MKEELFEYLRQIYKSHPRDLIEKFNLKYTGEYSLRFDGAKPYPCFFTGNLEIENPIVTISLNPKYDDKKTLEVQNCDFNQWLEGCSEGFISYIIKKRRVHTIFGNLAKVFFGKEEIKCQNKMQLLQDNVVNLDWCYYYSSKFKSVDFSNEELKDLFSSFDKNLMTLIRNINPRIIFIHGKSLEFWFQNNCETSQANPEATLIHGKNSYNVYSGFIKHTNIPVVYQEWFINRGNKNENLEIVRKIIEAKMNK